MEKLEGIKIAFKSNITRKRGFTQQFIDDVYYLIEQAEKVEQLENEVTYWKEMAKSNKS